MQPKLSSQMGSTDSFFEAFQDGNDFVLVDSLIPEGLPVHRFFVIEQRYKQYFRSG